MSRAVLGLLLLLVSLTIATLWGGLLAVAVLLEAAKTPDERRHHCLWQANEVTRADSAFGSESLLPLSPDGRTPPQF
jgi:hypothetical protein